MTPRRIAVLAGALALALHVAGCGGSSPPAHPVLEDGIACGTDSSACGSGHCSDGICCRTGNCCRAPSDCPAQYRAAATCTTPGATTDCQGTRTEATCVDYTCGSTVIQDDGACSGQSRDCGAYAPVACSAAADQPAPACGDGCTSTAQCAQGYTCDGVHCVAIAGAGQECTGTGQGTCATGLKCENGACCGTGAATCCNAQHACPSGLACNATTATCGLTCTIDTSVGCADAANTYCTDGSHCAAKVALGEACGTAAGRCGSGHCVDGVCCDTACTGQACQRCDAQSAAGKGHCGWVSTKSDPDRECGATTVACSGTCQTVTTAHQCTGAGYACESVPTTANVPSGSMCVANQVVPVSATSYCNAGAGCSGATASQWYTSCDGMGSCRPAGDSTDAAVTQHVCPSGLACNAATASCAVGCTIDTSVGCADPVNTYCADGSHCVAKKGLGESCGGVGGRCGTGNCVDGVCCDGACTGQVCQRCDALSAAGNGHCGPVSRGSHPDGDCSGSAFACSGQCQTKTTTYQCSGGYACEGLDAFANVPSGSVCASNQVVAVSASNHCTAGGGCSGAVVSRWYTSCDGTGSCRAASDSTDALLQPTKDCGDYACNPAALDCYAPPCTSDVQCAPGTNGGHCVTSAAIPVASRNTCQSGDTGAYCDDPVDSAHRPHGSDCDTGRGCTSARLCALIEGQACTSSAQCGENIVGSSTIVFDLTCRAAGSASGFGTLVCPAGAAMCCD